MIGTIVLRMMLRKTRGDMDTTKDRIPLLMWMRWPAIVLPITAAVALGMECLDKGPQLSAQFVVPAVLIRLTVFEYINSHHVQLQQFDHAPDWQGLIPGRGFRPAHLAREIRRWKHEQRRCA